MSKKERALAERLLTEGTMQRWELEAAQSGGVNMGKYLQLRDEGHSHSIAMKNSR